MALIWLSACIMVSFRGGIKTKPRPDWKGLSPLVLRGLIPTFQRGFQSISHGSPATPPPLFKHIVRPGISSVSRAFAQGVEDRGFDTRGDGTVQYSG